MTPHLTHDLFPISIDSIQEIPAEKLSAGNLRPLGMVAVTEYPDDVDSGASVTRHRLEVVTPIGHIVCSIWEEAVNEVICKTYGPGALGDLAEKVGADPALADRSMFYARAILLGANPFHRLPIESLSP